MLYRFIKKILFIFPVIFLLAILVFFLSEIAPGDKVEAYLDLNGVVVNEDEKLQKQDYIQVAKSLNLDLPSFYFSIQPSVFPDTLYKLNVDPDGKIKRKLFTKYLSLDKINQLFDRLEILNNELKNIDDTIKQNNKIKALKNISLKLNSSNTASEFEQVFKVFSTKFVNARSLLPVQIFDRYEQISNTFKELQNSNITVKSILPKLSFYGTNNRFHKWFGKVLKFDFGISIIDGQKVSGKILKSLKWTLLYILIAYILTFAIAIPLGIYTASNPKKKITKALNIAFIAFHSMPLFWLATLSVVLFTTSEISGILHIFPSIGIGNIDSDMSVLQQFSIAAPHLILPSLVIAIHSGAYLGTLISRNMKIEMKKKYFLALLARGIPKKKVILNHIFPNSLLPLITLLVVSLPASLAGSVITEVIFNIPGMGRLLYDSILNYDWNIVFAIVLIIGFATYLAYMSGDFLYSYFNPKIKYYKTNE